MIEAGDYELIKANERGEREETRHLRVVHYPEPIVTSDTPVYGYVEYHSWRFEPRGVCELHEDRHEFFFNPNGLTADNRAMAQCFWKLATEADSWYHRNGYRLERMRT